MRRQGVWTALGGACLSACAWGPPDPVSDLSAMAPLSEAEEAREPAPMPPPAAARRPDTRFVYRRASEQARKTLNVQTIGAQLEAIDALIKTEKDAPL